MLSVARELEAHVAAFAARVDRRRRRLDLAVLLYTHEKEVRQIRPRVKFNSHKLDALQKKDHYRVKYKPKVYVFWFFSDVHCIHSDDSHNTSFNNIASTKFRS